MKKITLTLLLFVLITTAKYSLAQYQLTIYGPENDVYCIAIDDNGDKWIGTDEAGVIKFDGTNRTYYTITSGLADNDVRSVTIDNSGIKWFATGGGVSKFDGTTWTTYTTDDGLVHLWCKAIATDSSGNIWIGTYGGVSKFDGTNWTSYTTDDGLAGNNVQCITIDSNGDKWFGTDNNGVSKFDGTTWTTYTTDDGLAENDVNCITIDDNGDIWFGTDGSGISKFDGANWITYNEDDGLVENDVECIVIDDNGDKWIGTNCGGVSKFDGTNWTTYTRDNGLAGNCVFSIVLDSYGDKWIGTSYGVSKFDGTNWTTYITLVDRDVESIAIDINGDKWFGTEYDGVSKFDGTNWTTYNEDDGLVDNQVQCIAIDSDGNKWIGTDGSGISKFDGTNWTTYTTTEGLADDDVQCIAIDSNGDKWFGTVDGLSKFDGTNWTTYTTADGLADDDINCIIIANNGDKWFGTDGGGVSKYDGTSWTTYTTTDGLVNNDVQSIAIDNNGNIWFGTDGSGVSKFNGTTWTTYTTADGLAGNDVQVIAIDSCGNKWFGTKTGGVSKFDGTNWVTYTEDDGILADDDVQCIVIDSNGDKWIATDYGGVSYISCETAIVDFNISGNLCDAQEILFINTSTQTDVFSQYEWDIDNDGETDYFTSGTSHIYGIGEYTVKLTVYNDACQDSKSETITINPGPVINLSGGDIFCTNDTGIYVASSSFENSYSWVVDGGIIISGQDTEEIGVEWDTGSEGSVYLQGTVNSTGCVSDTTLSVTVNPLPGFSITSEDVLCAKDNGTYIATNNSDISYEWVITGGTITSGQNTNEINVEWGDYPEGLVSLTGTLDSTGCISDTILQITISPEIKVSGNDIFCANDTGIYIATSNLDNSYVWIINGGSIISGQNTNEINVAWADSSAGSVYLQATVGSTGCVSDSTIQITINPLPVIQSIFGESTACTNTSLTYGVTNDENSFFWQANGGEIDNDTINMVNILWEQAGGQEVRLTETNSFGCTVESILSVNVADDEQLDIPEIKLKFDALLIGTNILDAFASYQWYNEEGAISGATGQFYEPPLPLSGEYYLIATDNNNCKAESNHLLFDSSKSYSSILAYPNPVSEELSILFPKQDNGSLNIKLFNNTGQAVIINSIENGNYLEKINTADLMEGMYFLIIESKGKVIYNEKIIVQR